MIECVFGICFFFKQKTAYEMRISDWSSDVCSSDLPASRSGGAAASAAPGRGRRLSGRRRPSVPHPRIYGQVEHVDQEVDEDVDGGDDQKRTLDDRVVPAQHRGDDEIADAGQAEQDRKSTRLNSSH